MFGYVRINKMDLTFREYENYKGYYCGLCKYLKENHGEISRIGLNYDITFLIVILSAIYKPKTNIFEEVCLVSPFKRKKKLINEITEYAASMNVLLTYYKLEDNLLDDKGVKDILAYNLYKSKLKIAHEKYPHKSKIIKEQMKLLNELEKNKEYNIDKVSNTFGEFDVPQKQNMSFDWNLLKGVIFGIRTSEYDKKQILAKLIKHKDELSDFTFYQAEYSAEEQKIKIRKKKFWRLINYKGKVDGTEKV